MGNFLLPNFFAQNKIFATGKREDISPQEISRTTGIETHQTNRSMRVIKLFDNDSFDLID